jgi:DNA polymerase-1
LAHADEHELWERGSFRAARFEAFLLQHGIAWPSDGGRLKLDDDTFRQMSKMHPIIAPIRELRHTLSQLRLNELAVGADGRNRSMLSPFRSKTGRNQPSNSKYIYGPSVWLRGLIQAPPGRAVAYVDWSQQEFGIAAALSGDTVMMEAYASGDPYLAFAKQAGAVPDDATKTSHPVERSRFKICALAVQYGMGEVSLAFKLGEPQAAARELLRLHRQTYRRYWEWNEGLVDAALLGSPLRTVFGWTLHPHSLNLNARSLSNFPMQANGAEMLRLACCMATERGIKVCAPVHDALLIEADADRIVEAVDEMQALMAEASRIVLDGFELLSDAKVFRYPERYEDERGTEMWALVTRILDELRHQGEAGCIGPAGVPVPV